MGIRLLLKLLINMQLVSPFDTFDPKSRQHAGRVPAMLHASLEKAQYLLNGRSRDEIEAMLADINWMFHHPAPEPKTHAPLSVERTNSESTIKELVESFGEGPIKSPGDLLFECVGKPHSKKVRIAIEVRGLNTSPCSRWP